MSLSIEDIVFSDEATIIVALDDLRIRQQSSEACNENAQAIDHLETAYAWLLARKRRMARESAEEMNAQ